MLGMIKARGFLTKKNNAAEERQVPGQWGPGQDVNNGWLKDTCQSLPDTMLQGIKSGTEERAQCSRAAASTESADSVKCARVVLKMCKI